MSRNSFRLDHSSNLRGLDVYPDLKLEHIEYANNKYKLTFCLIVHGGGGLVEGLYLDNKGNLTVDPWCDNHEMAMAVFEILKTASLSNQ